MSVNPGEIAGSLRKLGFQICLLSMLIFGGCRNQDDISSSLRGSTIRVEEKLYLKVTTETDAYFHSDASLRALTLGSVESGINPGDPRWIRTIEAGETVTVLGVKRCTHSSIGEWIDVIFSSGNGQKVLYTLRPQGETEKSAFALEVSEDGQVIRK